jgi:T5SS/PEP-CTERM-associated repeat protein
VLVGTTSMAALGLALATTTPSLATDWTGNNSTDWFDGGNWSGGVPTIGDNAFIDRITPHATVVEAAGAQALNLIVGVNGTGSLTIQSGGTVNSVEGFIGGQAGSTGTVTVDGTGSHWTNSGELHVGTFGIGSLTIRSGGTMSTGIGLIGDLAGSTGTVTVDGAGTGSSWTNSGSLLVGVSGAGTLTIQNGGGVNVGGSVLVALNPGSTGTLNIGAASGQAAAAPGTLNTSSVAFGAGTGLIVFNHTASNYTFAPTISGAGAVRVEAGTTILTANNTYTGGTTINAASTLQLGGATGSIIGDVVDNGVFQVNRSNVFTFGGVISGTGSFGQIGTGTTTLKGWLGHPLPRRGEYL